MKRERNRRSIPALLLALLLAFSVMVVPTAVLADDIDPTNPWMAFEDAAIRKVLVMPRGTAVPAARFYFHIDLINVDGHASGPVFDTAVDAVVAARGNTVAGAHVVRWTDFHPGMTDDALPSLRGTGANMEVYAEVDLDFLNNVVWPHAGIFEFEITEIRNTNDLDDESFMNYNPQNITYRLRVYIANVGPDGELGVWGIVAADFTRYVPCEYRAANLEYWTTADTIANAGAIASWVAQGEDNNSGNVPALADRNESNFLCWGSCIEEKIDPRPGQSDMIFENHFTRIENPWEPGDDLDDAPLYVEKFVTGALGDRTRYFEFEMDLQLPPLWIDAPYYDEDAPEIPDYVFAFIIDADGAVVTPPADNFPAGLEVDDDGLISLPLNEDLSVDTFTFFLRHGQRLVFTLLPVGTTYNLTEFYVEHYIQRAELVEGSELLGTTNINAPADGDLVVEDALVEQHVDVDDEVITENWVHVTNDRPSTPPMGVIVNNLPFVGLISLAVISLGGFITVKIRSNKRYAGLAYE